jgi:CO dehydrogenase nickel-insertion accessory protein CooC1
LIQSIEVEQPDTVVVADMEAGLEHLSWAGGTLRYVDLLLIVLQPTEKVLLTASRVHQLAVQLGIPDVCYVGSRATEADRARFEAFAAHRGGALLGLVPDDDAVRQADRRAECVIDSAPEAPSVRAIERLADALEARMGRSRAHPPA